MEPIPSVATRATFSENQNSQFLNLMLVFNDVELTAGKLHQITFKGLFQPKLDSKLPPNTSFLNDFMFSVI